MSETATLRQATQADAGAIHDLTHEAYLKWVAVVGRRPLPMTVDYAEAVKTHRFDLLEVGPTLAALIETAEAAELLLIVNVAVRPSFQGRGLGKRLLKHAEELAASLGLQGTRLYTNQLFVENIRLYESVGYVIEKTVESGDLGMVVHMKKVRAPV